MMENQTVPKSAGGSFVRPRIDPILRLLLAWAITLGVLVYAWGRTLVFWMKAGRPELLYVGLLAGGLLGVIGLTAGLSTALDRPRLARLVSWAVPLSWLATIGALVFLMTGTLIPRPLIFLLFIPASLWVLWVGWMFYRPFTWLTRLVVLLILGGCLAAFVLPVEVEGLTGDRRVNFAWRHGEAASDFESLPAGHALADLTATTDHDFAQFLGPQRLGMVPDARLDRDWKTRPPREVWRRKIGAGWGSFAVVGAYAVTQEQRGHEECVVCYQLADGAPVWLHADPVFFNTSMGGPGPRATPTIAEGKVYAVGATGLLNCLNGADGRKLWAVDILKDNASENISHGVCASPLVFEDKVVVCPTGSNGISLAAYHRDTGKRLWQAGKYQASYGSPLLAEFAGTRQILLYTSEGISAHQPEDGQLLWDFSWTNGERVNCSQPIPHAGGPDQVFVATGYGTGCALIQVERTGAGAWTCRQLWKNTRMKTTFTTAVVKDRCAYGLDDAYLACLDLKTGKQLWKGKRYEHGQVLLAGDLLVIQAENGAVALVEASPQEPRELGRIAALAEKTWNNPALAGKYLLVRNSAEAACYELPLETGK